MSKGIKFNFNKVREYNSKRKKKLLKISSIIACLIIVIIWIALRFLFKV